MKLVKPIKLLTAMIAMIAGIGTAAGVAWPTFGMVANILKLAVGGTAAILLGSIFSGVFMLVGMTIAYWLYNELFEEKKILNQIRQNEIDNTINTISCYYLILLRKFLLTQKITHINEVNYEQLIVFIRNEINDLDLNNRKKYSNEFLKLFELLNRNEQGIEITKHFIRLIFEMNNLHLDSNHQLNIENNDEKIQPFKTSIKYFLNNRESLLPVEPLSQLAQIKKGVTGFATGLGSIVGCSAGMSGMLASVGVFVGFASIPILGWALLGAGVLLGVMVACAYVYVAREKHKQQQLINQYQAVNNSLEKVIQAKEFQIEARLELIKNHDREGKLEDSPLVRLHSNISSSPKRKEDAQPISIASQSMWRRGILRGNEKEALLHRSTTQFSRSF